MSNVGTVESEKPASFLFYRFLGGGEGSPQGVPSLPFLRLFPMFGVEGNTDRRAQEALAYGVFEMHERVTHGTS